MEVLRKFHYIVYLTLLYYMSVVSILSTAQQTITIPNQNWKLVDYLCRNQTSQVVNYTTLELSPSEEHVIPPNLFCVFLNKNHVGIQSSGPEMAVVRCEGNGTAQSGLGFVLVSHLTVDNIQFENCGGIILHNSLGLPATRLVPPQSSLDKAIVLQQQAVLFLSLCTNVSITNVTFNNYRGYAIYAINVFGDIKLRHITITNSYAFVRGIRSTNRTDLLESGSGVYLHFVDMETPLPTTYCKIDITDNSVISNNWNVYPTFLLEKLHSIRLQNQPEDFPLSGSAALSVHLEQSHFKVKLDIDNMETRNSMASTAGSMKIISRNTINNFDMNITKCAFIESGIFKYSNYFEGAGIQMFFDFSFDKLRDITETAGVEKASITIFHSVFERNTARVGAAIAVFSEAQNISDIEVNLKSILFIENEASDDGDCVAAQHEQSAYYQARSLVLTLESIIVEHIGSATNIDVDRSAALRFVNLVTKINGTMTNPTVISNGNNSAIRAYNTKLFLSRDVHFIKNSALRGGAIALEANSFIFFVEPANILFACNNASLGGAIYSDFTSGHQCVMQFTMPGRNYTALSVTSLLQLDFNITFVNNSAEDGNDVYAQPIFNCSWYSESVVQLPRNQVEAVYNLLFTFLADNKITTYKTQMRSHPQKPCFCQKNTPWTPSDYVCLNNAQIGHIETFPGKSFQVNLIPLDQLGYPLRSVIEARVIDDSTTSIRFRDNQHRDVRDLNGTSCYAANYTLYNAENVTVAVKFGSLESDGQFIQMNVNLQECPFGFEFNKQYGKCDCIPLYKNKSINCDIENGLFMKTDFEGGIYWIGETNFDGNVIPGYAKRCPEGYCERNKTLNLKLLNKTLCVGNRANEICGQCKPGMSMKFGTTDCGYCSNYWLFTILLYVIAGVFLVFILFLLKMTISGGTLISVSFYAQLFSINLNLLAGTNQIRFATVFISLLNLELGFPICFYNGMDFAGKLGFQFVFPIYLWLIVGLITYLCRYSTKLSSLIGSECAKVFVTLFYFSYTKLVRTVFEVFVWGVIETADGNTQRHIVWFFDGSVQFLTDWNHLLLMLVSLIMFLAVISPYKFFLFLSQWCLHSPWISRHFKPLIDANLAPFKDRWRFWLGMRLFVTEILILISIIFTSTNPKIVAFTHVAIVMTMMMFQAYIKPYKSKFVNALDLFFIINFLLFVTSCVFLYVVVFTPETVITTSNPYLLGVEVIYVGSAFIVFIGLIIYHAAIRVKGYHRKQGRTKLSAKTPTESIVEVYTSESITLESNTDRQNNIVDSHDENFVALREPLLDD